MKALLFSCLFAATLAIPPTLRAQEPDQQPSPHEAGPQKERATENPSVHDPVLIREGSRYYLFATGMGISVLSSDDLVTWKREPPVFREAPQWAVGTIPGFRGHIWAPDIIYHGGRYHVFYSCSAFGKNTSAIGHASTRSLDPQNPEYGWTDHGMVVQSAPGRDDWNAIDPNIIIDEEGNPWMDFGSFWGGIKMVKLNSQDFSLAEPQEWHTLARRTQSTRPDGSPTHEDAIEAPFIIKKNGYYYLFVSFDYCCRGNDSNYKIAIGRSEKITGPYLDREGKPMEQGGGTILLQGNEEWSGVGHCAVLQDGDTDYLVAHAYIRAENGASRLVLRTITWENGWPTVADKAVDAHTFQ